MKKKNGGDDPANDSVKVSTSGITGASDRDDTLTLFTIYDVGVEHGADAQYTIVTSDAPHQHDPLEEALARLDAAYTDAVNMAIASYVESGLITEDEGRRIYEQRQVWQEVRL